MSKWCIGIDLGGTFIKFGLLDGDLKLHEKFQLPTPTENAPDAVIQQIAAGAGQMIARCNLPRQDIVGVGVGSAGLLDVDRGIVRDVPNIPAMENVPLLDRISEILHLPMVLENDANAAAHGEFLCGAGRGTHSMVLLTLGTGVGSGIIMDGKVLRGSHHLGGELGHIIVAGDGEPCGCGQKGCLERYASATYLTRYAMSLLEQGRESSLQKTLRETGDLNAKDVQTAAEAGDALAAEAWSRAIYHLAIACVNICRIFDPDRIVLGGGMAAAGESLTRPLLDQFRRLYYRGDKALTEIVLSELGNDAGVIGAASLAWSTFGGKDKQ